MARGDSKVEITGIKQMARKLKITEEQIEKGSRKTVVEAAEAVRNQAKDNAPEASGRLKRGINIRYAKGKLEARVKVTDKRAYYGQFIEYGTKSRPARPFMTPAAEQERGKIRRRLEQNVKKELP